MHINLYVAQDLARQRSREIEQEVRGYRQAAQSRRARRASRVSLLARVTAWLQRPEGRDQPKGRERTAASAPAGTD